MRRSLANSSQVRRSRLNFRHLCVLRHVLENLRDDMVGRDAFRFGFEIQNQTMTQRRGSNRLDVFETHVESSMRQRPNFRAKNQRLAAARTAAETQVLIADRRGSFSFRMRREN